MSLCHAVLRGIESLPLGGGKHAGELDEWHLFLPTPCFSKTFGPPGGLVLSPQKVVSSLLAAKHSDPSTIRTALITEVVVVCFIFVSNS